MPEGAAFNDNLQITEFEFPGVDVKHKTKTGRILLSNIFLKGIIG